MAMSPSPPTAPSAGSPPPSSQTGPPRPAGSAGARGSTDATGAAARFNVPFGVATDSAGSVYVADGNSAIRKITPAGVVTTLAGTAGSTGSTDGTGAAASFSFPLSVATDSA